MGAEEGAHVLQDAEDRDLELPEHVRRPLGVNEGHLLGRGDDDPARDLGELGKAELHVPRPRGKVHHQVVQLPPVHVLQELLQGAVEDGPPPGQGLPRGDDVGDGEDLDPVGLQGEDPAVLVHLEAHALGPNIFAWLGP